MLNKENINKVNNYYRECSNKYRDRILMMLNYRWLQLIYRWHKIIVIHPNLKQKVVII